MRAAAILLQQALERRGPCRILAARERPWASATFIGARHRLRLAVAEAPFLDGIEEAEFDLGEYLLADIVVVQREWAGEELIVDVEALTIEDWREPPSIAAFAPVETGQGEPRKPTNCGTKRAFVPLAAA